MHAPVCPKCGARMESGTVLERGAAVKRPAVWVPGREEPEPSGRLFAQEVRGSAEHPVITFRCPRCGYLESYAPPR